MSRRTKFNKSRAKAARGELRQKEWKKTLKPYYVEVQTASKAGKTYTKLKPFNKNVRYSTYFHNDMVAYFSKFFPSIFL